MENISRLARRHDAGAMDDHSHAGAETGGVQIRQRTGGGGVIVVPKILGSNAMRPEAPHDSNAGAAAAPAAAAQAPKKPAFTIPNLGPRFVRSRFMDEGHHICLDEVRPLLAEHGSEFTVVACIAAQGAGKSTTLCLTQAAIAANGKEASAGAHSRTEKLPFDVRSPAAFLEGTPPPYGIDLCVSTLDRLIMLDVQPLFNYDFTSDLEMQAELHLLLFLTSICHTLLVVVDTPVDMQLLKLLRLVAMLKSQVVDFADWVQRGGSLGDTDAAYAGYGAHEASPHSAAAHSTKAPKTAVEEELVRQALPRLVVVFNKIGSHIDDAELFKPTRTFLQHTLWKAAPSVSCIRLPTLVGDSVHDMLASKAAHSAGAQLREEVFRNGAGRGRFGKDGGLQLTEREWLQQVKEYWDIVDQAYDEATQEYITVLTNGLETYGWPKL